MSGSLIADNWSLQNVSELLVNGLDDSTIDSIQVDQQAEKHSYVPLLQAAVSFEALFDLITDIVLRDQLLVDKAFTSTWTGFDSGLQKLLDGDLVRPFEFLATPEKLDGPRAEFVERLCVTKSIKALHQKNSEGWNRAKEISDPVLSTTLWGGAGMLARAFISEKSYTPHPLRRRLFQQANVVLRVEDSTAQLIETIKDKRVSLSKSSVGEDSLYALRLSIPAVPILVVREATDASQILPIALQLRDEFQDLRDWLGEYQQILTDSDFSKQAPFKKVLRSISTYIESLVGSGDPNAPTFTAGIGALKVAFKGHPTEYVRNQFGVRATANRLILSGSGLEQFNRLLGFFGHRHSQLGVKLVDCFRAKK